MQTRFITTREQELVEGEYVEGVVVEFAGKYFWLLENGDCEETDVSEADLNCADDFVALVRTVGPSEFLRTQAFARDLKIPWVRAHAWALGRCWRHLGEDTDRSRETRLAGNFGTLSRAYRVNR